MVVARVVLKGAKSYRYGGRRWLKDVPQTISSKTDDIKSYQQNGYFNVKVLKETKEVTTKKKAKASDDSGSKKSTKKTSGTGLKKRS